MKRNTVLLTGLLLAGFSSLAKAASIDLAVSPSSSTLTVGSTTTVDLTISGLGAMSAPSLSAFDLDLQFDPAVLSVSKVLFGSSMPPYDQLNLEGFGAVSGSDTSLPGSLHLYEVSLDSPAVLDSTQLGAFILAEVTFTGQMAGNTSLNLAVNTLGDAQANPLSASVTNGSVTVTNATATPEPASVLLAGIGGALMAMSALASRLRRPRSDV